MHLKENNSESSVSTHLLLHPTHSSYCFEIYLLGGTEMLRSNLFSCLPPQWVFVWFATGTCAGASGPLMESTLDLWCYETSWRDGALVSRLLSWATEFMCFSRAVCKCVCAGQWDLLLMAKLNLTCITTKKFRLQDCFDYKSSVRDLTVCCPSMIVALTQMSRFRGAGLGAGNVQARNTLGLWLSKWPLHKPPHVFLLE